MMTMIKSFSNRLIQLVISCTSFTDQLAFFGRSAAVFWTKALSLEHESHQYFFTRYCTRWNYGKGFFSLSCFFDTDL